MPDVCIGIGAECSIGGGGGGTEAACCLVVQAATKRAADMAANFKTVEYFIDYLPKTKSGAGLPKIRMHPRAERFNRHKYPNK